MAPTGGTNCVETTERRAAGKSKSQRPILEEDLGPCVSTRALLSKSAETACLSRDDPLIVADDGGNRKLTKEGELRLCADKFGIICITYTSNEMKTACLFLFFATKNRVEKVVRRKRREPLALFGCTPEASSGLVHGESKTNYVLASHNQFVKSYEAFRKHLKKMKTLTCM